MLFTHFLSKSNRNQKSEPIPTRIALVALTVLQPADKNKSELHRFKITSLSKMESSFIFNDYLRPVKQATYQPPHQDWRKISSRDRGDLPCMQPTFVAYL